MAIVIVVVIVSVVIVIVIELVCDSLLDFIVKVGVIIFLLSFAAEAKGFAAVLQGEQLSSLSSLIFADSACCENRQ